MQRVPWYRLVAVGAILFADDIRAQTAPVPRATVREIATIDGYVDGFVRLPGGRVVIYEVNDSTFAYDVAAKRRTLLGTRMRPASVSAGGDRFAFSRSTEDGSGSRLWTMPIGPRTGTATGPAQLVSQLRLRAPRKPKFSPDGSALAFHGTATTSSDVVNLMVVPSTGGAERVIASYPSARSFGWTADGTALDVDVDGTPDGGGLMRITTAAGAKRSLFPPTRVTTAMAVGVTADSRIGIFTSNPDVFLYRTAAGVEGEIAVPLPALDDGWGFDFSLERDGKYLTTTYKLPKRGVRVLDMETGRTRSVLPNETTWLPAWSPDGRRLALLTGEASHYDIAIVNADGSGVRRYPMSLTLGHWTSSLEPWSKPWSPDGRFLAFYAQSGSRIGWTFDRQRHIAILDVASGATRLLATVPDGFFGAPQWRTDGGAIRFIRDSIVPVGTPLRRQIFEVDLDGTERVLRNLSAEFPGMTSVTLGATEAVVAVRVGQNTERFAVPLGSGAARKLPDPGPGSGVGPGLLLAEGRLAVFEHGANATVSAIRIVSTVGAPTRTIRMPFGNSVGTGYPDGTHVVVNGKVPSDSLHKFFLVSLEDGAQRLLGEIAGGGPGIRPDASPDRKFVAYVHDGPYTSTIHEIDFSPAIQAILRR